MSKKPKTVKAWAVIMEGQIWPEWCYSTRKRARYEAKHGLDDKYSIKRVTIRILPTPGNKRSAL